MANRGWTVFMRKMSFNESTMNFGWTDYKKGFGDLDADFWMGNEFLHQMSTKKKLKMLITFKVRSYRSVSAATPDSLFVFPTDCLSMSLSVCPFDCLSILSVCWFRFMSWYFTWRWKMMSWTTKMFEYMRVFRCVLASL